MVWAGTIVPEWRASEQIQRGEILTVTAGLPTGCSGAENAGLCLSGRRPAQHSEGSDH